MRVLGPAQLAAIAPGFAEEDWGAIYGASNRKMPRAVFGGH